jgi:hypothetical protein
MSREFLPRRVKKVTQNQRDQLLQEAIWANNMPNVLMHLGAGANTEANWIGPDGRSTPFRPLFVAAVRNSLEIVTLLSKFGASLSCCDFPGVSALFFAAIYSLPQMVTLLVELGADLNDEVSLILCVIATYSSNQPMCLLLVSLGADPAMKFLEDDRSALTHYGGNNPLLVPAVKAALVAELVAARAEYVDRSRRQATWDRRSSAMLFLQGSGFFPMAGQRAAQREEQQHVDTHTPIAPAVLVDKDARVAHLVSSVLTQEGLSRRIVSFL